MDEFETEARKAVLDAAHDAVFRANAKAKAKLDAEYSAEVSAQVVKLKRQPDDAVKSRAFLAVRGGASRDDAILFNLRIADDQGDGFIYPSGSDDYKGDGKGTSGAKALKFDGGFYKRVRRPPPYDLAPLERCARQWEADVQAELNRL